LRFVALLQQRHNEQTQAQCHHVGSAAHAANRYDKPLSYVPRLVAQALCNAVASRRNVLFQSSRAGASIVMKWSVALDEIEKAIALSRR